MLSCSAEYALLALTYLAEQPPDQSCGARDIAGATSIPLPYLWKILKVLTDSHLLVSCRGVGGGYRLAREPKRIRLEEVLVALSEDVPFGRCVLKHTECDENHPCAMHRPWDVLRKRLSRTTVADLKSRI